MEDTLESLMRGNVASVKTVLTTVALALAVYQLALIAVAKIAVVRWGLGLSRGLPLFGLTVFALLAVTWATSAPDVLGGES